jgi:disease resistance protein RPM1
MKSLQTLRCVSLDMDGAAEVIKALGNLKQIRELGLCGVWTENGTILSSSINEMKHLEKLCVSSKTSDYFEVIDLHLISAPTMLQKLTLFGRLEKLPKWIPKLPSLVVLRLELSCLTEDPMQSLKNLQHLLYLSIGHEAYHGKCLHFQNGWFLKLKELEIVSSHDFEEIVIEKGALPSLKKLKLCKQIPVERRIYPLESNS